MVVVDDEDVGWLGPKAVADDEDSGWIGPVVVADDEDGGWLGPKAVADDEDSGWLRPVVVADDEDGGWLGPADVRSTWSLVSCSNNSFISCVKSSICEKDVNEYVPVDADAPPLGVIADDENCG